MAGSLVVSVRSAIKDGLTTLFAGLPDFNGQYDPEHRVEVSYAYDLNSAAAERVFTGRSQADTPPAALRSGTNYRNETGTFDLIVLVAAVGGSAEDADERALAIGTEVEEWIAARKSNELAITGLNTLRIDSWDLVGLMNDHGNMAELTYKVRWTARLT